jgi:dipeptidyl aminopeptidase/acylaminoacyl peptidase
VTRLELTPADSQVTIAIGGSVTLRARALAGDGTPVPEAPITWRVGDSTTVAFDPATGVVRGRRTGVTEIAVRVPAGVDTDSIRIIRVRVVAGGLAASPARVGIPHDSRTPVDVAILDDQHTAVGSAMSLLTWTSTADTVARVEGDAIVAMRPGRARLTARAVWDSTVTVDAFVVGDVIVAGQHDGHRDLLVKWNAGQNWSPLTSDSLVELQAAWSPDLTRVLYSAQAPVTQRTPTAALYLMNVDGSERVRLTDDSSMVRFPAFVPGSRRVVFEWSRGGRQQVWALDSAGAAPRQLTQTPTANMAPSVSPDGRRIVYVSSREGSPGHSTWGVYSAAVDGTDERPVLSVPAGQRVDAPIYSPDGRSLYFLRTEQGRPPTQRVYRRAVDVTPGDTAVAVSPPALFIRSFSVSADGGVLALNVLEAAQGGQQSSHVVLYTVATGATQSLDASPEERLASPVLRPPTPPSAVPQR